MRIGVDARELVGKPTGVGRHLAGLLRAWSTDAAAARHTFVLYAHEPVATPLVNAELRVVPGAPGTLWEQVALPRAMAQDRLNVLFAPGYTAPLAVKVPTVLLVHDLSFVAHPEWFRWREGLRRRLLTRWSSRRAEMVLTVSETARRDILARFRLAASQVRCIYPGVLTLRAAEPHEREPMVLFVGSIFNRRHLPALIRAFALIARRHPGARLAIVGDNRTHPREDLHAVAAAAGVAAQVAIHPYLPDAELAGLYGRARAFALISDYEGFGHPPLEALAAGVPPVVADTEVAREVCGDAALYVPPGDVAALTGALERLLFDEAARRRIFDAGPAVLARYSWARAAAETLSALERAT